MFFCLFVFCLFCFYCPMICADLRGTALVPLVQASLLRPHPRLIPHRDPAPRGPQEETSDRWWAIIRRIHCAAVIQHTQILPAVSRTDNNVVDDDLELNVLGCRVDILGTNYDQCLSMVQHMLLHVHRNHKAHSDGEPRTATSTFTQLLNSDNNVS